MDADLIVRGGTVVDGTGAPARRADVAIAGDRIVAVDERLDARATREIDAEGRVVTPGFVDVHTHLDAQLGWDPLPTSSCWHGITSVVLGNCGVTFAPVAPGGREFLAEMMESVEDIPRDAILEGLPWDWTTYGDYLGWLDRTPKGINVGGLVGHCALRVAAMGERAMVEGSGTPEDIARMCEMAEEALQSGALGISTSRTLGHVVPDGRPVPGTWAGPDELLAFGDVLGRAGRGHLRGRDAPRRARRRGAHEDPRRGRGDGRDQPALGPAGELRARAVEPPARPVRAGHRLHEAGEREGRGWCGRRPRPAASASCSGSSTARRGTAARRSATSTTCRRPSASPRSAIPQWRARLIADGAERPADARSRHDLRAARRPGPLRLPARGLARPRTPHGAASARSRRSSTSPSESDGTVNLNMPLLNQRLDAVEEMLDDELVTLGLADAGAHVGQIMDTSQPTFLLTYWVRERQRWTLEEAVRRLTSDTADLFGFTDRGVLRPGAYADVNVIDLERLTLPQPEFVNDLPNGAGRYIQGSPAATTTRSSTARSSWTTAHTPAPSPVVSCARCPDPPDDVLVAVT